MRLGYEELKDLISDVNAIIRDNIETNNRVGTLEDYLKKIGVYDELYGYDELVTSYPYGKILVIGDSRVNQKHLIGILKSLGIEESRVEFVLDYEGAKRYNFDRLRNSEYRVILAGPMPHSIKGKGDYSSMIEKIRDDIEYPRVVELRSSSELKITKENFRSALESLLEEGYII